jgi:uncharacterized membrane protein YbhN (UPF0104 family)
MVELQTAMWFTNLAVPSYVGQVAVNARFFQKHGVPPAAAVSSGVLTSAASFITQVVLVLICLPLARNAISLSDMNTSSGGGRNYSWVLWLVIGAAVVSAVVFFVPKLRRLVSKPIHEAWANFAGIAHMPRKIAMLFGGNLGSQLLFACCLGSALLAFGYRESLPVLIVVNNFASVLAGVAPVPGGMGVAEAGLVAGLTAAGVPSNIAVPAVVIHRIATFWITPIPGYIFFRKLTKSGQL